MSINAFANHLILFAGIENRRFKREQVIEALTDMKVWLMVLFNLWISIPNGGLTNVRGYRAFIVRSTATDLIHSSFHP